MKGSNVAQASGMRGEHAALNPILALPRAAGSLTLRNRIEPKPALARIVTATHFRAAAKRKRGPARSPPFRLV
jgi:hypothetical protein